MNAPLLSNVSLITELLVSASVIYTFYQGYKHNKFPTTLVSITLLYEILFNISYMATRTKSQVGSRTFNFDVLLAIIHGTLSLIMFVALIVFMMIAWGRYKKGQNYFKDHKILTWVFLFFWTFSVLSGVLFYILRYIIA